MFSFLLKHLKLIIVWGVVAGALALVVSLLVPKFYSAESQILIISRDKSGLDPFTQTKLAERVGDNLTQVVQTEDFFYKVMEQTGSFDRSRWTNVPTRLQRKHWHEDVQASMMYGTSLLKLTVYGKSKDEAKNFADAVTQTLITRGWEYAGGDVSLKVVNSPLVSRWPMRPNIHMNTLAGFLVGAGLAAVWLLRYKRHTFLHS